MFRRLLFRCLAVLMGVLVSLLLIEGYLRATGFEYRQIGTFDPVRGWGLKPGATTVWAAEGYAHVAINSHGFRDKERTIEKPRGVFRIAVLGDSFVEARQVELADTFCARIEHTLPNVEVLNFGISAYGTAQEYLTLRDHAMRFKPDIVLLAFLTANDVLDNCRALNPGAANRRPYFVLDGDSLKLENSTLPPPHPTPTSTSKELVNEMRLVQYWKMRSDLKPTQTGMNETEEFHTAQPGLRGQSRRRMGRGMANYRSNHSRDESSVR